MSDHTLILRWSQKTSSYPERRLFGGDDAIGYESVIATPALFEWRTSISLRKIVAPFHPDVGSFIGVDNRELYPAFVESLVVQDFSMAVTRAQEPSPITPFHLRLYAVDCRTGTATARIGTVNGRGWMKSDPDIYLVLANVPAFGYDAGAQALGTTNPQGLCFFYEPASVNLETWQTFHGRDQAASEWVSRYRTFLTEWLVYLDTLLEDKRWRFAHVMVRDLAQKVDHRMGELDLLDQTIAEQRGRP